MDESIEKRLQQISLPKRPKTFGEEYDFPEDPSLLSDNDLGTLMFKLTAWQGYILRELMLTETRRSVANYKYENRLQGIMPSIEHPMRKTKDRVLAEAYEKDKVLKGLLQEVRDFTLERDQLKRVAEIYEVQVQILSREVTRRAYEFKGFNRAKEINV